MMDAFMSVGKVIHKGAKCEIIISDQYPRLLIKACDDVEEAKREYVLAKHMGKWDIGPKVYTRSGSAYMMEKMDTSLHEFLRKKANRTMVNVNDLSDQLTGLFRKLILALPGLFFCDLKPENVVMDDVDEEEEKRIRLIDFDVDWAVEIKDEEEEEEEEDEEEEEFLLQTMQIVFALNTWFLYPHQHDVVFFKDVIAAEGKACLRIGTAIASNDDLEDCAELLQFYSQHSKDRTAAINEMVELAKRRLF